MQEIELLHSIRSIWLHRTVQSLAHGVGVREDFREQLEKFFDLFEQVIVSGDPAWINPMIEEWSSALTQTDLEAGKSSLTQFVKEITTITFDVCREILGPEQALDLFSALFPCLSYAFEKAAEFELQARINYISNQLQQAQLSLERLDRSKSDFIAVAAHELKTPLTLIEGYTAMLKDSLVDKGSTQYEIDLVGGINNGTRRLRGIVDDMIDVSLIDNSLLSLNFQPVWINRLFSMCIAELEKIILERNLTLELIPFPGSGDLTFADPERLMQVFRNVLTNAVKYTPDGGKISVDGRRLPGFIEILITDTGIGIDPEDLTLIFEKFIRIGNTSLHSSGKTKFKGGGPGLGLHIAKGIIEAHGGAIWAESQGFDEASLPGSIFHILLPVLQSPPDDKTARLFAPLIQRNQSE